MSFFVSLIGFTDIIITSKPLSVSFSIILLFLILWLLADERLLADESTMEDQKSKQYHRIKNLSNEIYKSIKDKDGIEGFDIYKKLKSIYYDDDFSFDNLTCCFMLDLLDELQIDGKIVYNPSNKKYYIK